MNASRVPSFLFIWFAFPSASIILCKNVVRDSLIHVLPKKLFCMPSVLLKASAVREQNEAAFKGIVRSFVP